MDEQFICETINWSNCEGIDIVEFQIRSGEPPDGFARFRILVTLNVDDRPVMQQQKPIHAATIEEAFTMAPQVIVDAGPGMADELQEHIRGKRPIQRIITAAEARSMGYNGNRQQRRADAAQHNRMGGKF